MPLLAADYPLWKSLVVVVVVVIFVPIVITVVVVVAVIVIVLIVGVRLIVNERQFRLIGGGLF